MRTARQLVWFYVRPTLHAALVERATDKGHDLEVEIIDILERAAQPPKTSARGHLRVLPAAREGNE